MAGMYEKHAPKQAIYDITIIEEDILSQLASIVYATGDIFYYNGAGIINLNIGSEGQILTIAGGIPIWADTAPLSFAGLSDYPTDSAGVLTNDGSGALSWGPGGGGLGTVITVSVVTANGVSGSVANPTTTPAITLALGAITPTTVNGLTLAYQAIGFTIAGGTTSKTLTVPLDASVSGTNTGDQTNITGNAGTVTNGIYTTSQVTALTAVTSAGDKGKYLYNDPTTGVLSWATVASAGATIALDNLASVAMNASLQWNNTAARTFDIAPTANDTVGRALAISAGSTVTGGTADMAGGNLTLNSGLGKGTGASSIIFKTGKTLTTGSTLQTLTTAMTILGSGNVGIGTTAPGYALDVNGVINMSNGYYEIGGIGFGRVVGSTIGVGTVGAYDLSLYAGAADRLYIQNSTGNVGIGTTSPSHKLDVVQTGTTTGLAAIKGLNSGINVGTAYGVYGTATGASQTNVGGYFSATGGVVNNYGLIVESGNVGIGTTAPTSRLHLAAGDGTAGTAPLGFTSGTLLTVPVVGKVEFLADAWYGTITTGAARKTFAFTDGNITGTAAGLSATLALTSGGTGLATIADGSILATNAADTLSAITWHSAGDKVLTNKSGTISWETAAASGASTALDNLASVAINAALIPGTAGALDLGSTAKPWGAFWLAGTSGTPGTNQFKITGASTSGLRTITLPNASGTVVLGVTTGNGVSATNTAGALAFTLGAITPTTVNTLTVGLGTNSLVSNTAVGYQALNGANSGNAGNVAVGYWSLLANTSGESNSALGHSSLKANTTGSFNASFGTSSLVALIDGLGNTAVGWRSGYSNVNGNYNVFLGYMAGAYETGSNSFYVDNQNRTNIAGGKAGALLYGTFNATPASQTLKVNGTLSVLSGIVPVTNDGMAIGTTALGVSDLFLASGGVINWNNGNMTLTQSAGNLSIATGNLSITSHAAAAVSTSLTLINSDGSNGAGVAIDFYYGGTSKSARIYTNPTAGNTADLIFAPANGTNFTERMRITGAGVVSMTSLAGTGSRAVLADANGLLSAPVSDAEKKKDFTFIEESTAMAMLGDSGIRALTYRWRDKTKGDDIELGFTAQQFWPWKDEVKGLVFEDNGVKGLNYDRLTTLLWTQNKALLSKINDLENRVKMLESK